MEDLWELIVDFAPLAAADAQWKLWLASHDISALADGDIRVDTGRGTANGDVRRYFVRQSAMGNVTELKAQRK